MTLARSIGLPLVAEVTRTVSSVGSDAVSSIARHVEISRRVRSVFMDSLSDIRYQKVARTSGCAGHSLRGDVAAAYRALHRGGPTRPGPVARQKEVFIGSGCTRALCFQTRERRKRRPD